MRSLKTFLRNKKNRCCEGNKCVLVGMRRDFQNYPEFCNCGDGGSTPPVPPTPPVDPYTYEVEVEEDGDDSWGHKIYRVRKYKGDKETTEDYTSRTLYMVYEDGDPKFEENYIPVMRDSDSSGGEKYFETIQQAIDLENVAKQAIEDGTQEAYKNAFNEFIRVYNILER